MATSAQPCSDGREGEVVGWGVCWGVRVRACARACVRACTAYKQVASDQRACSSMSRHACAAWRVRRHAVAWRPTTRPPRLDAANRNAMHTTHMKGGVRHSLAAGRACMHQIERRRPCLGCTPRRFSRGSYSRRCTCGTYGGGGRFKHRAPQSRGRFRLLPPHTQSHAHTHARARARTFAAHDNPMWQHKGAGTALGGAAVQL